MKIKRVGLIFDKETKNHTIYRKDCFPRITNNIPITENFDNSKLIGIAQAKVVGNKLIIEGEIDKEWKDKIILNNITISPQILVEAKEDKINGVCVVVDAKLISASLILDLYKMSHCKKRKK